MPCVSYDEPSHSASAMQAEHDLKQASKRNDDMARSLCVAFNALEAVAKERFTNVNELIKEFAIYKSKRDIDNAVSWWIGHKQQDDADTEARKTEIQMQRIKERLLNSLSEEEIEAIRTLGL